MEVSGDTLIESGDILKKLKNRRVVRYRTADIVYENELVLPGGRSYAIMGPISSAEQRQYVPPTSRPLRRIGGISKCKRRSFVLTWSPPTN